MLQRSSPRSQVRSPLIMFLARISDNHLPQPSLPERPYHEHKSRIQPHAIVHQICSLAQFFKVSQYIKSYRDACEACETGEVPKNGGSQRVLPNLTKLDEITSAYSIDAHLLDAAHARVVQFSERAEITCLVECPATRLEEEGGSFGPDLFANKRIRDATHFIREEGLNVTRFDDEKAW
jgi:hypothetical protein